MKNDSPSVCFHLLDMKKTMEIKYLSSILWCNHINDHPQEELVKFGYSSKRKIEKFKNPSSLTTYYYLFPKYGNFRENFPSKFNNCHNFFP